MNMEGWVEKLANDKHRGVGEWVTARGNPMVFRRCAWSHMPHSFASRIKIVSLPDDALQSSDGEKFNRYLALILLQLRDYFTRFATEASSKEVGGGSSLLREQEERSRFIGIARFLLVQAGQCQQRNKTQDNR